MEFAMSPIHNIAGNPNASSEYQEYLARLSANLQAKRRAESGEKGGLRTFDSAIEPDRESDQERGDAPDGEAEGEPGEDADGKPSWQAKA